MRFTKRIAGLVGVLGLTAAGLFATLGPANAQPAAERTSTVVAGEFCEESDDKGENGAKICWNPDGDKYRVCDIDHDDNQHAWGRPKWQDRSGDWHKLRVREDGGDDGCNGNNVDVPENRPVRVKVCVQNGADGDLKGCDRERGRS